MKLLLNLVALAVSVFTCTASAQDNSPEFGKIDKADLLMTECPFDKGANAMVLINNTSVDFSVGYYNFVPYLTTDHWVRIKIFNEAGFSAANIIIPYVSQQYASSVKDIEAIIYTLDDNGNVVKEKLSGSDIIKEKSNSKKSLNSVNFTFPNLKKGAVIEYKFSRDEKYSYAISPWFMQERLPTALSRYTIVMHGYTSISYYIKPGWITIEKDSIIKDVHSVQFNKGTWNFTARNIPGFKREPFMRSFKDNLQRAEFSVMPSAFSGMGKAEVRRAEIAAYVLRAHDFGMQFSRDIEDCQQFIESIKNDTDDMHKVNAVYEYVKQNVKWNRQQNFWCDSVEQCWGDKAGSSGSMNILLLNLLRKAGVHCYPLLVSTRDNGIPEISFPNLGQFNGVDVFVTANNDRNYILDCTQDLSYNNTPFNILNSQALLIGKERSLWVTVADDRPLFNRAVKVDLFMDSTGAMHGDATATDIGVAKTMVKEEEEILEKKEEKNIAADDEHRQSNATFADSYIRDLKIDTVETEQDSEDTLVKKTKFEYGATNTENMYFLNPFLFALFKKNPFSDSARMCDIDFGCNQAYSMSLHFAVPANFSIESVPKTAFLLTQDSSIQFKRDVFTNNNEIVMRNSFVVNRTLFTAAEYKSLKDFFTKVYALINDEVVLKKHE